MTLGEKITALRKKKKYSQAHLSRMLTISRDAISKYERDEMTPSVENARKIADFLGVSLDYLVNPEAEPQVLDQKMVRRMQEIEQLDTDEQTTLVQVIDAFIRDAKARRTYAV